MSSMSAPLFVGGVPTMGMNGLPTTFGNYFFVDPENGSDGNVGTSMKAAYKTVAKALSMCVTNNDDVICLRGTTTDHVLTAMLAVTINRVHFVGLDGAWRPYGQAARLVFSGTTGATNIAAMKNTGVRNTFTNIKFDSGSTITESIYTVVEAGEYAQYTNCEFYKSTDLDQTGAAEFVWNGDSTIMDNCTVGSLADALVGDVVRACVLLTKGLGGVGKVCRDGVIRNTRMWRQGSHVNNRYIYGANATDVERMLSLEHVAFLNNGAAAAVPAYCITTPTLTVGKIVLDPTCYTNCTKLSGTTGVLVTGPVPTAATSGVAVNAA